LPCGTVAAEAIEGQAMHRRQFITLLIGTAAWPLAARAQQSAMPIVGCLAAPAEATYRVHVAAIRLGLKEAGFIDGQNVRIEFRWAEGQYDRLDALAAELISRGVNVIMTLGGGPPIRAAKAATSTIPIVFHLGADPVQLGLVASLNRPGGNITGVTLMTNLLEAKRFELLHKMVPTAKSIAILANPTNQSNEQQLHQLQAAMHAAQLNLIIYTASNAHELESSFVRMSEQRVDALTVLSDVFFTSNSARIAALSADHRIPTIAHSREFPLAGGLMSYGTNLADAYRLAGTYAGRILKGEKPAELPVIEPTRFDFLINLQTAKRLGLTVPPILLATADEVIE
jgi:putative ABC transport system substrate-binding protein